MIEMMQMGTLDAVTFGRHSQIDPRMECINLPFLFASPEVQTKFLRGEEGAEARKLIEEMFEAQGIYMLGMFEAGDRQITSTKPINSMEDLKGLVIRTPNTDVLMDSFEAWGASPTPMDINDLYTALQTDVFLAAERFARVEGILPAPESAHAIKVAIDEAEKCRESGEKKTIVFGLTGTGYFDLVAYERFHNGEMTDSIPTDEQLAESFAALPNV